MRARLAAAAMLVVAACGGSDGTPRPERVSLPTTTARVATGAELDELRAQVADLRSEQVKSNADQVHLHEKVDAYVERASRSRTTARSSPKVLAAFPADRGATSSRCGGDLPPCYVMERESSGDLRIWNGGCYAPVGWNGSRSPCGGSTASGKWQIIRTTWARYGGFLNAADAPEDVQDAKARALWAGGRGCSHWSACR